MASGNGFPCSWVRVLAMTSGAFAEQFRRPFKNLCAVVGRSVALRRERRVVAASMAPSASARVPYATSAMVDSSAGLMTASVEPPGRRTRPH